LRFGGLPEQGLKASHRLGSKSGAVLLFLRLISGGDRQVKQVVDFVVFFVLFPRFIFLCCAVYFQFFSAKLLQNLRLLSNR